MLKNTQQNIHYDLSMISARTCCSPAQRSFLFHVFIFTFFSGLLKMRRNNNSSDGRIWSDGRSKHACNIYALHIKLPYHQDIGCIWDTMYMYLTRSGWKQCCTECYTHYDLHKHSSVMTLNHTLMDNIAMIRADFQQGMESVSLFKMWMQITGSLMQQQQ